MKGGEKGEVVFLVLVVFFVVVIEEVEALIIGIGSILGFWVGSLDLGVIVLLV